MSMVHPMVLSMVEDFSIGKLMKLLLKYGIFYKRKDLLNIIYIFLLETILRNKKKRYREEFLKVQYEKKNYKIKLAVFFLFIFVNYSDLL